MTDDRDDKPSCPLDGKDQLIPLPVGNLYAHHAADHSTTIGSIVPVREGEPMPDNARFVHTEEDGTMTLGPSVAELRDNKGPAQVATQAYRDSWDRTFGPFGKPKTGLA